MNADKLRQALEDLASEHGLIIFEEPGLAGSVFYLMKRDDAHAFMLANWETRARMH